MSARPLKDQVLEEPYRFEFFQAVRLIEKFVADRDPVGGTAMPNREVVRFRSNITLDFPASEIDSIRQPEAADDAGSLEMLVNFMGLAGASGVLPAHYTELLLDRIRHRDTALWAFLDIFTHRSVSLFYRAWEKYRFPIAYEQGRDDFTKFLFDLSGIGTEGLRGRMALSDESLLPYSGLVGQQPHSVKALENMISDYFGVKAKIEQFFGQWIELDHGDVTRIGQQNAVLGSSSMAGTSVWDQQSKFRITLGPMNLKQFQAFLPSGSAYAPLQSMTRFMTGLEVDFDVQLALKAKQVPGTVLTTRAQRRPMLGWTSWLKTRPFKTDDEQVILGN